MKHFTCSLLSALAIIHQYQCNAQAPVHVSATDDDEQPNATTTTTTPDCNQDITITTDSDGSMQSMIRVLPFFLLAIIFFCCSWWCGVFSFTRQEEQNSQNSTTSNEERRAHLESLLIVEKVTKLPSIKQLKLSLLEMAEEGTAVTECGDCGNDSDTTHSAVSVSLGEERTIQKTKDIITHGETMIPYSRNMNSQLLIHDLDSHQVSTKGNEASDSKRLVHLSSGESHGTVCKDESAYCKDINRKPSSCDICLGDYEIGDEICISPNKECIHRFHKDCCLDWLMKSTKCPECRREYLPNSCSRV